MFKNIFLILSVIFLSATTVFAEDIPVKVTPKELLTTCNQKPMEGDYVDFVVVEDILNIKKGSVVTGLVTSREENGLSGTVGSLYIEQFKLGNKNLKGVILEKGNAHPLYFEYNPFLIISQSSIVRGGEAFLKPNKNIYTLYFEEK